MTVSERAIAPPNLSVWSRPTVSWMLYDLANTVFSFAILTFYFPRWVVNDAGGNEALLSYALSFSMVLMLLTAPVLGALSDQTPRRLPFLIVSTLFCIVFTTLLGTGGLIPSLLLFGCANYFFQAGLIFYDALLPEVSTESNRGKVSGFGVGIGYIGSFLVLGIGSLLIANGATRVDIFRLSALIFFLFALPCFFFVRERPRHDVPGLSLEAIRAAFRSIGATATRLRDYPGLSRFLVGRVFYTDVANTVIIFMAIYVEQEFNFTESQVTIIGAVSIIFSIVGGFTWGLVLDRWGPKRTLSLVLAVWVANITLGVLVTILHLPSALFYLVAILAGFTLGGTWAADRTLMLRLSPPRYLGQFYGIYAMVGRFGQIVGPLLWGFVAVTLGLGRPAALFSLAILTAIAYVILRPVSDTPRPWRPDELVGGETAAGERGREGEGETPTRE